jgi:hypothetical protein
VPYSVSVAPGNFRGVCGLLSLCILLPSWQTAYYLSAYGVNPGLSGAKISKIWGKFIAPEGPQDFSPGFQPWEPLNKAVRPERARDDVGEMPFECHRKGIGHLLGRRYNLPLANNGHRHKVERWRGPIEICFSRLLLITMIWRPFRARRPGGRFPGLKPWAKFFSPSGAINYPQSCLSSRHSTLGCVRSTEDEL